MMSLGQTLAAIAVIALVGGCVVPAESVSAETEQPLATAPAHPPVWSAGAFGFTTLDIGQGDSAVVVAPGGCAAILDGGPTGSGAIIKSYLRAAGVTRLDFAVVSHFHEDHLGGLDEVEQGPDAIPIAKVYDHGGVYASTAYTQYERQFEGRRVTAARGDLFSLCEQVSFRVVASDANGAATSDENARSVVVKISYGAIDVLVGGDLVAGGPDVESTIAADVGPVEVYKVHHHGSSGSSGAQFLDTIRPTVSFISAALHNSYGHPSPAAVARLAAVNTAIWRTEPAGAPAELGHVELTSRDGSAFDVSQHGQSTHYSATP